MLVALALLAVAGAVRAQSAVCNPTSSQQWLLSPSGEDPCSLWADVVRLCDPSGTSISALSAGQHYGTPTGNEVNQCYCNRETYNLMAACTYCQDVSSTTWLDETQWADGCGSSYNYFPPTNDLYMPAWVDMNPGGSWTPTAAEDFSGGGGSSATDSYDPSPTYDPGYVYDFHVGLSTGAIAAIAIICGVLPLVSLIVGLIVYCRRQSKRKAFYGPLAAYYQSGGLPPPSATGMGFVPYTPAGTLPPMSMYSAAGTPAPYDASALYDPHTPAHDSAALSTPPPGAPMMDPQTAAHMSMYSGSTGTPAPYDPPHTNMYSTSGTPAPHDPHTGGFNPYTPPSGGREFTTVAAPSGAPYAYGSTPNQYSGH